MIEDHEAVIKLDNIYVTMGLLALGLVGATMILVTEHLTRARKLKIRNKLPKFTRTGRDLRPVRLTHWSDRPVQPVKIAGNLQRTGQDLLPVHLTGRVRPVRYLSVRGAHKRTYRIRSNLQTE